ncbi:MAG TPA: histidinol dehydrogenase [Terriglobales bacterium]|nr:histidinol dehydrogenase [Terriglobales bacterium]
MSAPRVTLRRLELARSAADPSVAAQAKALLRRGAVPDHRVREGARAILAAVKAGGDTAVRDANARFGGGRADGSLLVSRAEMEAARDVLPPRIRAGLEQMIANIRRFAETELPETRTTTIVPGVEIERRWVPLSRVGVYAPGGSAAYPSSLLMGVVPAKVADVETIVVASPADPEGRLDQTLLGAAGLVGVDVFIVAGGAQAVGAMAYGLPEAGIAPVDRIVGPGNSWVTAAKLEVFGECGIDLPAGPSEVMVVADASANAAHVASDLLSQAEHGPDSPALLVTWDAEFAVRVEEELGRQLETAARRSILERSLAAGALVVLAPDRASGLDFVNAYAPEHLSVVVDDVEEAVARLRNAGSLFVGPYAPESAGDYASGANHVLPTGGLARSCGALSTESYGKFMQVQRITRDGLAAIRDAVEAISEAEGLMAHKRAVELRFEAEE